MKPVIYIFLFSLCFTLNLKAQQYDSFTMDNWVDGSWKTSSKSANTFDGNGNIIKVTIEKWNDQTSVWDKTVTSHTLNSNSTINYSMTQIWDSDQNKWVDTQKTIFTYDESKRVLTESIQMWDGTKWMDMSVSTHTYNASGQPLTQMTQMPDFHTGDLRNFMKITYTYNPDGTENQNLIQVWGAHSGTWENSMRSTNTYNVAKKILLVLTEEYESDQWFNNMKSTMAYNADGSVKESLVQDWDNGSWIDSWKELETYNANGSITEKLIMDWLVDQSKWENGSRWTYTYHSLTFIQSELAGTDQVRVFPNPFTDAISIDCNTSKISGIQLFTDNGQLIWNFVNGEPLSKINLASLKNGIYFLNVVSPESQKVVKLLKCQ